MTDRKHQDGRRDPFIKVAAKAARECAIKPDGGAKS